MAFTTAIATMKVLLIQVDGSMPNLALMKLSAWHKRRGDIVGLIAMASPSYQSEAKSVFYKQNLFFIN